MAEITCRELIEFLGEYYAGELESDRQAIFEAHVGMCPPCKDYLDTYRATVDLTKGVCEDLDAPAPDDVPEQLVAAILKARKSGER